MSILLPMHPTLPSLAATQQRIAEEGRQAAERRRRRDQPTKEEATGDALATLARVLNGIKDIPAVFPDMVWFHYKADLAVVSAALRQKVWYLDVQYHETSTEDIDLVTLDDYGRRPWAPREEAIRYIDIDARPVKVNFY